MSLLAPSWAVGAQALDGQGDPHLQDGVHFRVVTDPSLGLPLRPFIIYRMNFGNGIKSRGMRTDVTWVDSHGAVLHPPFQVSPDNPVTGYLPVGATSRCVWVKVDATAGKPRPPLTGTVPIFGGPAVGGVSIDRPSLTVDIAGVGRRDIRRDLLEFERALPNLEVLLNRLRVDAWKGTELGLQVLGARGEAPYDIGGSEIHGVLVTGRGVVRGLRWIDWRRIQLDQMTPWRFMGLPVQQADRYEGVPGALTASKDRVKDGAPQRFGLHDRPQSANPAAAPAAQVGDEAARLAALRPNIDPSLTALLADGVGQPELIATQGAGGPLPPDTTVSEVAYSPLASLLLGAADPTIGRYLGYLDRDESPAGSPGDIIAYVIRGFWSLDVVKLFAQDALLEGLPKLPELLLSVGAVVTPNSPPNEPGLPFSIPREDHVREDSDGDGVLDDQRGIPLFDWHVPALTTLGAPLLPPWTPSVGPQVPPSDPPSPDVQGHWNSDFPPPDVRRGVELPVERLVPGASLAFARDVAGTITGLNRRFPVAGSSAPDRAHGILPSLPASASTPSEGTVSDRAAPPAAHSYRIAQHDWFGRWSRWATRAVPEKERPKPPPPVIAGEYLRAAVPSPVHSNPLWGELTVRCRLPPVTSLPPGGFPITRLELQGTIDGIGIAPTQVAVPGAWASNPSGTFTTVSVVVAAPPGVIGRGDSVMAVLRGRFVDTDGGHSPLSQEAEVLCVDARPPAPVVIDPTLKYSARPDATGRARVTLTWPVIGGGRRFRVYFCDETRLVERLERMGAGLDPVQAPGTTYSPSPAEKSAANALIAAWALAADDAPARGAAFTDGTRPALMLRPWFQQLTGEPLEAPGGATSMRFQHELSGSLRTLAFYRVVSVSANNVESAFADAPLLPFAVPNLGGPSRPMLEVAKVAADDPSPLAAGSVRLVVRLIRGTQPPTRVRLRRSSVQSDDPRRMAVALESAIAAPMPADVQTPWEFTIDDDGSWAHDGSATLRPFTRYSWRVEVQGPTLPGSTAEGEWSPASPAASTLLLPDPPLAPTMEALSVGGTVVHVSWDHPGPLAGGAMGGYRFDIYRKLPGRGAREERIASVRADDPRDAGGHHFLDDDLGAPPSAGIGYRVVVVDPVGRMSAPSDTLTLP